LNDGRDQTSKEVRLKVIPVPAIRSFIAIETPPEVKADIAKVQEGLRTTNADVRWESTEKFHITLKFLGNVDEPRLNSLADRLQEALSRFGPFNMTYRGVGCFPNQHHPRIIWIGAENEDGSLTRIQETAELVAEGLGFQKEERQFHPHITIGRVKGSKNLQALVAELGNASFNPHAALIKDVLLMKSDLKPTGSVYSVLRSYKLKNG
jgi:2'-5' RNA ligase